MCKISISNMLWLALMSDVQNKHLPMLERQRYAVRHSQPLCKFVSGIIPQHLFSSFFLLLPVLKTTQISGNFKASNGYFLQILDENWLDDTKGRLVYLYSQKCIVILYQS